MLPVLFINSRSVPYVNMIISGLKTIETRSRNTLRALVGCTVIIAETGSAFSRPVVRCSARIARAVPCYDADEWNRLRHLHQVPEGSQHDWQPGTTVKWLYYLEDVKEFYEPYYLQEGRRHGRVWMEYNGSAGRVCDLQACRECVAEMLAMKNVRRVPMKIHDAACLIAEMHSARKWLRVTSAIHLMEEWNSAIKKV